MALPLVAVLVAFAGCLGPDLDIVEPEGPRVPWRTAFADVWIVAPAGCGFCTGDPDIVEQHVTAVYRDGSVLVMDLANSASGRLEFTDAAWPDRGVAWSFFNATSRPPDDRVHRIVTSTLVDTEWNAIRGRFTTWLAGAKDPGEPDFSGTADYGGSPIVSYGAPRAWDVNLNGFEHQDDEWGAVLDQMGAIGTWARQGKTS